MVFMEMRAKSQVASRKKRESKLSASKKRRENGDDDDGKTRRASIDIEHHSHCGEHAVDITNKHEQQQRKIESNIKMLHLIDDLGLAVRAASRARVRKCQSHGQSVFSRYMLFVGI